MDRAEPSRWTLRRSRQIRERSEMLVALTRRVLQRSQRALHDSRNVLLQISLRRLLAQHKKETR